MFMFTAIAAISSLRFAPDNSQITDKWNENFEFFDLLFRVTRSHAKKLGEPLNLFIQKFARRCFLFITGEKKNTFHLFQF